MAYDFQLAIDTADPHAQAAWWAETLGWEVDQSDEDFIRRMIAEGHATEGDTTTYNGVLVWKEGAAILHPDTPEGGLRRRIYFQLVPEAKTVKNRVHMDVRVGEGNVEKEVARLIERGARELYREHQGPHHWVTMADPEGNEFCVS